MTSNEVKINLLCEMIRTLYLLSKNIIDEENNDALSNHDCLTVGTLFTMFLSEELE